MWQEDSLGSLENHIRPHQHTHCSSVLSLCICRTLSVSSSSCTARGVVQLVSMRPDIASSPLEVDHWKTSHLPRLHCSSMSSGALLQASFYRNQATTVQQEIPDFSEWGWHKDGTGTWQPLWTTLNDASAACDLLVRCGCLKRCMGKCKCNRHPLQMRRWMP